MFLFLGGGYSQRIVSLSDKAPLRAKDDVGIS